jgi:hypothetical protein
MISPLAEAELSNSERWRGIGKFLRWKLFVRANLESMKQSEELESIRVRIFCMFSVCILINRAEGDQKEAALR